MDKKFVRILSNIDCNWEGLPPVYRLYVNDELFAERTWTWRDMSVQEVLQIEAVPGEYVLSYELVGPNLATIRIGDLTVGLGPAEVISNRHFRIV